MEVQTGCQAGGARPETEPTGVFRALGEILAPLKRRVVAGVWVMIAGLLTATLLGLAGEYAWWLDLFSHFPLQYAVLAGGLGVVAALLRQWHAVGLAGAAIVVNFWVLAPLYEPPPTTPVGGQRLELLHINVLDENRQLGELLDFIRAEATPLVFLREVEPRLTERLEELEGYRVVMPRRRGEAPGLAILAQDPLPDDLELRQARLITGIDPLAERPSGELQLRWAGRGLAVLSVHPPPPMTPAMAAKRDRMLAGLGTWAERRDKPRVVMGDLNATPWSAPLRGLLRESRLVNSQAGFGVSGTWPSSMPAAGRIPIDHCLHSLEVVTVAREVGPDVGSDHRPLKVALQWAEARQ